MTTPEVLLRGYREDRSEEAFGELVKRYVDLVYATALRRLNGDVHLAEDVTQTVFSDLALKARTSQPIRLLGGWLHQHTCFTAAKVTRAESRRRAREREAVEMNSPDNDSQAVWQRIAPFLDQALCELDRWTAKR